MSYETIQIEAKDASRTHVLAGTYVEAGAGDNTANVTVDIYGLIADIPIFYHCPDSETADGNPFSADDRVLITNSDEGAVVANMKVVGFEDGLPRECGWESFNGPDIDTNHPWACLAGFCVCGAPTIVDGHLEFNCDNPEPFSSKGNILKWNHTTDTSPPPAGKLILEIQIEAAVSSTNNWGAVYINVQDVTTGANKYFVFDHGANYGLGADEIDVGDNGGDPMEINLQDYGIDSVDRMSIEANIDMGFNNGHAEYSINYINFSS